MGIPITGFELMDLVLEKNDRELDSLVEVLGHHEHDFFEAKAGLGPEPGQDPEPGKALSDYHWHVAKAVIALANTAGGVVVLGLKEEETPEGKKFMPVGLDGITPIKKLQKNPDALYRGVISNAVYPENRSWKTDNGKESWSCTTRDIKIRHLMRSLGGRPVFILLVEPVPLMGQLIMAQKRMSNRVSEVLLVRILGEVGEVRPLETASSQQRFQEGRPIYDLRYFTVLKDFLKVHYTLDEARAEEQALERVQAYRSRPEKIKIVPHPEANLLQDEADRSLRARLIFPQPPAYKAQLLEVGIAWGLERGGFIGIIEASVEEVHRTLVGAEKVLRETLEAAGLHSAFPERWWLRLDPSGCREGPRDFPQLWHTGLDPDDRLIKVLPHLEWHRPDDGRRIIPGILLPMKWADQGEVLGEWCRQLCRKLFPSQPLAIVICVSAREPDEGDRSVKQLLDILDRLRDQVQPLPLMQLGAAGTLALPQKPEADAAARSAADPLDFFAAPPPGSGIKSLLTSLRDHLEPVSSVTLQNLYPTLVRKISQIRAMTQGFPVDDQLNCRSLMEDLEGSDSQAALCCEILQLLNRYGPEKLTTVISWLAKSPSPQLRYAALSFASRNDNYVDRWIQGTELDQELFPAVKDFKNVESQDPEGLSLFQVLILGIMRAGHLGQREKVQPLLTSYRPMYDKTFNSLAEKCENNQALTLKECHADILTLGLRAGIPLDLEELETEIASRLSQSRYFWWTLASSTLRSRWLSAVLHLAPGQRAVLGLIGPGDPQPWRDDPTLNDKIIESRRGLPLAFHPRSWNPD